VGHGSGWLAAEAAALGLAWHSPEEGAWLAAIAAAAAELPAHTPLSAYGSQVLGESFGGWCVRQLANQG
jgi:hypothetical protein